MAAERNFIDESRPLRYFRFAWVRRDKTCPPTHSVGMSDLGKRLLSACERGDLPEVRDLIENGAPLNAVDNVRARHANRGPHAPI